MKSALFFLESSMMEESGAWYVIIAFVFILLGFVIIKNKRNNKRQ